MWRLYSVFNFLRDFFRANSFPYLFSGLCTRQCGIDLGQKARDERASLETRGYRFVKCPIVVHRLQGLFAGYEPDIRSGDTLSRGVRGGTGPLDMGLLARRVGKIRYLLEQ